ncbi:MAG TPA: hypothetical protein VNS32_06275 [Flavisolibacter sp.]|nr:hypothetical protein [Flavisolibacter sp.]
MKQVLNAVIAFLLLLATTSAYSQGNSSKVSNGQVKQIISKWSAKPKEVANAMIAKYGNPNEATANLLIWYNNGPWKKTILYKEEVPHDFPKAHTDLLQQFIDYKTPVDKFDDLAQYDGSVIVERTKGEISARCDKEEMNFLALNLANDVATGNKTVEEARAYYAKAAMAFMKGQKDPYTTGLKFTVAHGGTADPDMPAAGMAMIPHGQPGHVCGPDCPMMKEKMKSNR